jgi:hypothetical protein
MVLLRVLHPRALTPSIPGHLAPAPIEQNSVSLPLLPRATIDQAVYGPWALVRLGGTLTHRAVRHEPPSPWKHAVGGRLPPAAAARPRGRAPGRRLALGPPLAVGRSRGVIGSRALRGRDGDGTGAGRPAAGADPRLLVPPRRRPGRLAPGRMSSCEPRGDGGFRAIRCGGEYLLGP